MSTELRNSIFYARSTVSKYLKFFFLEVSVGTLLDLVAVYAALSRIVVVLDYLSFILPALPLITSMIHGMNLGRGIWWWIHERYIYYLLSLPLRARDLAFFRTVFSLAMEFYPTSTPYYVAMLIVGISPSTILFVLLTSSGLFLLSSGVGGVIASLIREWFKIAALTSLFQWGLFALTPTLYALDYLAKFSAALHYLVSINPLTTLIELARHQQTSMNLWLATVLFMASVLALFALSALMAKAWRH
jgi:hypothetical protein